MEIPDAQELVALGGAVQAAAVLAGEDPVVVAERWNLRAGAVIERRQADHETLERFGSRSLTHRDSTSGPSTHDEPRITGGADGPGAAAHLVRRAVRASGAQGAVRAEGARRATDEEGLGHVSTDDSFWKILR